MTEGKKITKRELAMAGLGAVTTLALALTRIAPLLVAGRVQFPVSAFFQPAQVKTIADQLPEEEDDFIISAWDLVAREIAYEPVGSDIDFVDDGIVLCDKCYSVTETLERDMANCVGKSALFASILLNRLDPSRVYMVVGQYSDGGKPSGHAWAEVDRGSDLYLIETTVPPAAYPWKPASSLTAYVPYAIFTQQQFECRDHSFCLQVGHCDCQDRR